MSRRVNRRLQRQQEELAQLQQLSAPGNTEQVPPDAVPPADDDDKDEEAAPVTTIATGFASVCTHRRLTHALVGPG